MSEKAEYQIIEDEDPIKLSRQVTKMLNRGWKVEGGVQVVKREYVGFLYVQAIAIYPNAKKVNYPRLLNN